MTAALGCVCIARSAYLKDASTSKSVGADLMGCYASRPRLAVTTTSEGLMEDYCTQSVGKPTHLPLTASWPASVQDDHDT
ncbi:hypothetical protein OH77DRAFT_1425862 [Trametes cingulata]|nr:hypothetical protein OH77DRAFT_1425862 [Trametes cingulata]